MALPVTYKAVLKQKLCLTDHVCDFIFELLEPITIEFKAGQFMLIKTNHPETGELISRAYSIASAPHETGELRFNIEILPDGKMTSLMNTWEVGKEVEMQGPFGHFVLKSPEDRDLVFVGTGTGIAPLKSMVEDLVNCKDPRRIHVFFGVRHQSHIFYQEEFEKLAAAHDNIEFTLTLSRPEEGWAGSCGRVTAVLPECAFDPARTDVYLCGGKPMIDDVKQIFLDKGLDASQIFFEQFFL